MWSDATVDFYTKPSDRPRERGRVGYGTLSLCRPFSVIASEAEGGAWQPLRMVALHVQEIAASLAPLLPRDDVEGHR